MSEIFHPKKVDYLPSKKMYLLRAGFKGSKHNLDKTMLDLANEIYIESIPLVNAEIVYETVSIHNLKEIQVPKKFQGTQEITFFVSTIDKVIDNRIEKLYNNEQQTKAILMDAWASESIEELNERFDMSLREKHNKGTMRFSPGYGDIELTENNKIIKYLDCKTVKAHPISGMLIPQKSTVCMIGWY